MMWKSSFVWPWYGTFFLGLAAHAVAAVPGCSNDVLAIYSKLCDTNAVWGIVVEAIAALGIVFCFLLFFIILGSITFIQDARKRSLVAVEAIFTLATLGLYSLVFAFIIMPTENTCPTRRFLFGVLFAICFACLLAHCYALIKEEVPSVCCVLSIFLGLALVQVIINTQWLITTIVSDGVNSCEYRPMDFVMALIYVMVLIAIILILMPFIICRRNDKELLFSAISILTVTIFSVAIWITWITLYVHGIDDLKHRDVWDDPVLAIALVINATVFLLFHIIPMLVRITREGTSDVGNYQIAKDSLVSVPKAFIVENQAFSPEEAASHFEPPRASYDNPQLFHPTPVRQMMNGKNIDHLIPRPNYHPAPPLYDYTVN